ncbi:hypothetical protein J1N35_043828, partial [Gossypium stocksii]
GYRCEWATRCQGQCIRGSGNWANSKHETHLQPQDTSEIHLFCYRSHVSRRITGSHSKGTYIVE